MGGGQRYFTRESAQARRRDGVATLRARRADRASASALARLAGVASACRCGVQQCGAAVGATSDRRALPSAARRGRQAAGQPPAAPLRQLGADDLGAGGTAWRRPGQLAATLSPAKTPRVLPLAWDLRSRMDDDGGRWTGGGSAGVSAASTPGGMAAAPTPAVASIPCRGQDHRLLLPPLANPLPLPANAPTRRLLASAALPPSLIGLVRCCVGQFPTRPLPWRWRVRPPGH